LTPEAIAAFGEALLPDVSEPFVSPKR